MSCMINIYLSFLDSTKCTSSVPSKILSDRCPLFPYANFSLMTFRFLISNFALLNCPVVGGYHARFLIHGFGFES